MPRDYRVDVEVFPDTAGEWRWRFRASNGQITASSGEGFRDTRDAMRAAEDFIKSIRDAEQIEMKALDA